MIHKLSRFLLFTILSFTASMVSAHDFEVDGIYYVFTSDTTVAVTYQGYLSTIEDEYSGSITIPETVTYKGVNYHVTAIGDEAFYDSFSLTTITIPNSVKSIGKFAFSNCNSLTSVSVPNNVTCIGQWAFASCVKLMSVTIGDGVTDIEGGTFNGCSSLTSILGCNNVESIGGFAFWKCESLLSFEIPQKVKSIGECAFFQCVNLTSITIPEGVKEIKNGTFRECSNLLSFVIPEGVTSIGDEVFQNCRRLTSVTIPNSVTSIGNCVFQGCISIDAIYNSRFFVYLNPYRYSGLYKIPEGIEGIAGGAFYECKNLTSVTIPNSVKTIGELAFYSCEELTSITIPESVETIGVNAFTLCANLLNVFYNNNEIKIGGYAFHGTKWLDSQEDGVIYIGTSAYTYKGEMPINTDIKLKEGTLRVADCAFFECTNLSSVILPEGLIDIGRNAFFNCSELKSIIIPNSVTSIGGEAFSGCINLTDVSIGNSVHNMGPCVFAGCSALTKLNIGFGTTILGECAFSDCTGLSTISIPNSVNTIGESAFSGCSSLTSIHIPESVTSINDNVFSRCSALTSIVISDQIKSIGAYAFYECNSLSSITIPESVTNIGEEAFSGCKNLTTITIPEKASVHLSAFKGCTGLQSVTIHTPKVLAWFAGLYNINKVILGKEVTTIGTGAFKDCSDLTTIDLPDNINTIEGNAFENCSMLNGITLPKELTKVGGNAFKYCSSLKSIELPANAYINETAFNGCTGLTSATIYTPKVLAWFAGNNKLKEIVLGNNVMSIESSAFRGCTGLTSIELPNKLTNIATNSFQSCLNLKEVIIPESVQVIGNGAFSICSNLKTVEINSTQLLSQDEQLSNVFGNQVTNYIVGNLATSIGDNVFGDSNRKTVILPEGITSIGNSAFGTKTTIKVSRGSKTLLTLWNNGYLKPVDVETSEVLAPTQLTLASTTQTSAKFFVDNVYPEYTTTYNGATLNNKQINLTGLKPDMEYDLELIISLASLTYTSNVSYSTKGLNPTVDILVSPTSFSAKGTYEEGDAKIVAQRIEVNGNKVDGNMIYFDGLEPNSMQNVTYIVSVCYGENEEYTTDFSSQTEMVSTDNLVLVTLPPKVISKGEVIVAAESNIANDEEKVGFEWRRADAPDDVVSKSGEAFLYEGTMEGYLHNLASYAYWRYRPYYESTSGQKYYGDWATVEADDYSYFEPTVHTYAYIEVEGNSAEVKGYALRGTDEVTEQGFMYWVAENQVKAATLSNGSFHAPAVPGNANIVVASGQVMTASLTGLEYERAYNYVAYMKTEAGKIYYGEQQSFTTGEAPVGIECTMVDDDDDEIVARYDLMGRKIAKAAKGVNIVMKNDGTVRKIMVK